MVAVLLVCLLLPSPPAQDRDAARQELARLRMDANAKLIESDFTGAIQGYNRYLKLKPNHIEVLLSRGLAYYEAGQKPRAAVDILKARGLIQKQLTRDKGNARLYYHLANSHRYLHEYEKAIQHLETAARLDPTREIYRIELEQVKAERQDGLPSPN